MRQRVKSSAAAGPADVCRDQKLGKNEPKDDHGIRENPWMKYL